MLAAVPLREVLPRACDLAPGLASEAQGGGEGCGSGGIAGTKQDPALGLVSFEPGREGDKASRVAQACIQENAIS